MIRIKGKQINIVGGLLGWVWLAVVVVPVYYILVTSVRNQNDMFSQNLLSLPSHITFGAYRKVFQNHFLRYIWNSVFVTVVTVAIILLVTFMVAYMIVRRNDKWSRRVYKFIITGLAIPMQAVIIPVYYLIIRIGLYDTLWALILPSAAFAIPISVMILTNFLRDIPQSLFEAMSVDGASEFMTMTKLAIPMVRPAIVTVAIYDGLNVWNGFLFPLILTQSADNRVIPLSLWLFQGQFTVDTPGILAAVVLSVLPILTAYIFGRKQMVAGLTAGFSK
ncbi:MULTISPECIES: carbohydrate ABC transporter permease [Bifidobacterium]|uniref:Carbohydrate ABC transporter permease n=2 Tax=Bifidobacterium TaxID=1678 RepID=A0A556R528_9BIFI|nr:MULTISPECIES: carbohydrate ABC transporter permease [Bifidobacterium]MBI0071540.1 carbohydrate ABC transporter permease [Bifidobacterium sp. W8112]MBI0124534.1 carbohydrate ABC transporter permease [Bifidobacterium apousia]MBI0137373.1 carbohydrate ABC transporter permease [Bifidobacterium sp. W8120]TSJ83988.1 carbohydrate ABC transporter permease [Bifidobacterium apousia]